MYTSIVRALASPMEYTSEDGRIFASYLKALEKAEIKIKEEHLLKQYQTINGFKNSFKKSMDAFEDGKTLSYCGVCRSGMAIFPTDNGFVSGCHRGFPNMFESYTKSVIESNDLDNRAVMLATQGTIDATMKNYFFKDDEKSLEKMRKKFKDVYNSSNFTLTATAALIYEAALAGQASSIYAEDNLELMKAAFFIRMDIPCIYDNLQTTGTILLRDMSRVRLYCNGAIEALLKQI